MRAVGVLGDYIDKDVMVEDLKNNPDNITMAHCSIKVSIYGHDTEVKGILLIPFPNEEAAYDTACALQDQAHEAEVSIRTFNM